MEFEKNKLIKEVLKEYYEVFAMTLNTNRFVPVKINKKIVKYIFKNMQAKFRDINIYYLLTLNILLVYGQTISYNINYTTKCCCSCNYRTQHNIEQIIKSPCSYYNAY